MPTTPLPTATASQASSQLLKLIADVPLRGGPSRFDYQSFDETTGRLIIAHMGAGQLIAFDTKSRKVIGTVGNLPQVTGVLAVPTHHRIYASVTGNHQVVAIDDQRLTIVARIGNIMFPDGLAYAPTSHQVFVSDESGGGELVIDARSDKPMTTIDIGGDAGNTQFDPVSGCIVVAVQTRDRLVFIDPKVDKVVGTQDLPADCKGPHGFLIDAPRRLAFVSCEDNAMLLVDDLRSSRVTSTERVGDHPDVLAFDPGLRRLYVASEAGAISIFKENESALKSLGTYTAPHAHSVAIDPRTHLLYLPLESVGGKPVLRIMAPTSTP
jgi:DNA-binding beta-propeller fold protein YncE